MRRAIKVMVMGAFLCALLTVVKASNVFGEAYWEASPHFQYNIVNAVVGLDGAGKRVATIDFSVTDPTNGYVWNIKTDYPFTQTPASRLAIDIGWSTADYQNTGASGLLPLPFGSGAAAATPISVNALRSSVPIGGNVFRVVAALPDQAQGTGVAAMEGHPAWPVDVNGVVTYMNVPVKSAYKYFALTGTSVTSRREVVQIEKCKVCHTGTGSIPRLTLHGENRTEEVRVCVICHNPNQTDIPYRASGAEVSVDFKRMIHSIHAGGFRKNPFIVTGRLGTIFDFSYVRFPKELRNCLNCHFDVSGKGTYELPLEKSVLASTVNTKSVPGVTIDRDPSNDLRITPTAAVCSSCHDSTEALSHMRSRRSGGSFSVLQSSIDAGLVKERCIECHGPGRDKDIRRVHEIRNGRTED